MQISVPKKCFPIIDGISTDTANGVATAEPACRALPFLQLVTARAGDLDPLKVASQRYEASMDAAVALQENSPESAIIDTVKAYAATKMAYYDAARAALPTLLQLFN